MPPKIALPKPPPMPETLSKEALLDALEQVREEIHGAIRALPPARLFTPPAEGIWSPAEHLRHLVLATHPLVRALRLPAFLLALLFGRAKGSRCSSEVVDRYRGKIAAGAKARGPYVPQETDLGEDPETSREQLLADWEHNAQGLIRATRRLRERSLDRVTLPHPLLGKLTLREMLTWTVYHNHHHLERIRQPVEVPEAEDTEAAS